MLVVRPVETRDLTTLMDLVEALGPGMTTLPADRTAMAAKIEGSVATFAKKLPVEQAQYLLVLEDVENGAILGTAAVYPSIGSPFGFFSYKVSKLVHRARDLSAGGSIELLSIANDYTGATEVGSLAVLPAARRTGGGRLLARARYMLIANFPQLFAPLVMAEMRGWQDEAGRSPFWDAVGRRFFNMDFPTADRLSAVHGAESFVDLLPRYPIYATLLSEEARSSIGRPHPASAPAMAMLMEEDFRYESLVDIFDAGPQLHVERGRIRTAAESRCLTLGDGSAGTRRDAVLACTTRLDGFRVTISSADFVAGEIDAGAATMLGADKGEIVRVSPLRLKPEGEGSKSQE